MKRRAALLALTIAVAALVSPGAALAARQSSQSPDVTVVLDRQSATAGPGERLEFTSTIHNAGQDERSGLVAHLSIFSTDPGVYVDPEDWSPKRTQYVDELPAGESTDLRWKVLAVTSGPLLLEVSVTDPATSRVVSSTAFRMQVGGQRKLVSSSVLPVVAWAPGTILVLLLATGIRRRRHT